MKKILKGILILLILFVLVLAALFYTYKHINHSYKGTAHVFKGASSKQISEILESEGVVKDADFFYYYIKGSVWYHKYVKKDFKEKMFTFREGDYKFKNGDFESVIHLLVKGENDPQYTNVTFPEGITISQIATILDKNKIIKKDEFLAYVRNKDTYLLFKKKYPWLPIPDPTMFEFFEGYLRTTTYAFPKNKAYATSANIVTDMMLKETNRWYVDHAEEIEASPYSFAHLITIASIVEKEAKFSSDRPKIAQVFFNRLAKGIKLQSDMTAAYASGKHKVFLYYTDINIASPYNTYYVSGLPLGPISAPSEASFLGALHPAGNDFESIFFYARPNGETFYANTLEDHQHNVNLYQGEWKAEEAKQTAQ